MELRPYPHQVGGHSKQGGQPASLVDEAGRFLKLLQAGERGEREARLYAHVERLRFGGGSGGGGIEGGGGWREDYSSGDGGGNAAGGGDSAGGGIGTRCVGGGVYLALEDAAAGYTAPCVLDAKIGHRTWYPWAAQELMEKYRSKDEGTTQSSLGFRLCGVKATRLGGDEWCEDRHWGKALDESGVVGALRRFTANGALQPHDVLGPAAAELRAMAAALEAPAAYHMFSSSVLLLYEGAAQQPCEARVAVRLVDFAHAFPAAIAGGGPDANFRGGLLGLIAALEAAVLDEGRVSVESMGAGSRVVTR
ncbi:MAG: hypothetical protein J3K34DRAFT_523417 [Monoraphidium minutum]|nr:MAG: hypothetical protein J3K34DRAFT_523417 [Monoraphidium minutum]